MLNNITTCMVLLTSLMKVISIHNAKGTSKYCSSPVIRKTRLTKIIVVTAKEHFKYYHSITTKQDGNKLNN